MGLSVVQMGYEDEGLILSDWVHLQTNPMSVVFLFSIDVIASLFCEDKNEILHDFSSGWKRIKCVLCPNNGESLTDRDLTGISVHTSVLLTIPSLPFTSSHPPMYLVCCMDLLF